MELIVKLITGRPLITCLVIGVVLMTVWWLKFQKKLNMKWYWAPILSILLFAVGLVGAKLLALIEVGFDIKQSASMRIYGSIFIDPIIALLVVKLTKRNAAIAYDAMTVAALIGGVLVRFNCLRAGCCKGLPIFAEQNMRWPLVEMEIGLFVFLIIFFWNRVYKGKTKGLAYPVFVLIYGIFRFMIEWVRDEYTGQIGPFHLAHIWSLLAIIGATIAIWLIKRHNVIIDNKPRSKHKTCKKEVN